MLVRRSEIAKLQKVVRTGNPALLNFHLIQNFHLPLLAGLDEVSIDEGYLDDLRGRYSEQEIQRNLDIDVLRPTRDDDLSCGSFILNVGEAISYRKAATGEWIRFLGGFYCSMRGESHFENYAMLCATSDSRPANIPLKAILDGFKRTPSLPKAAALLCSGTNIRKIFGATSSSRGCLSELLQRVRDERVDLAALHWRNLEELVAALLEERGLKVRVTPRSNDGGRDIVAVGELVPGEPVVLAVEVKKKPVVGMADVRAAIYANRTFPALLIVTSGRFSGGVVRERSLGENAYRVFLKDGAALRQWISAAPLGGRLARQRSAGCNGGA